MAEATSRLPRRVRIGPYRIDVALATRQTLRDALDDETRDNQYDGLWFMDEDDPFKGHILIYQGLSQKQKWSTFLHEMVHCLNDLRDWHPQVQRQKK